MSFYQNDYDRCIKQGIRPYMDVVGTITKDENIDFILDLMDYYIDIVETLIANGVIKYP